MAKDVGVDFGGSQALVVALAAVQVLGAPIFGWMGDNDLMRSRRALKFAYAATVMSYLILGLVSSQSGPLGTYLLIPLDESSCAAILLWSSRLLFTFSHAIQGL